MSTKNGEKAKMAASMIFMELCNWMIGTDFAFVVQMYV